MSNRGSTLKSKRQGIGASARLDQSGPRRSRGGLLDRCLRDIAALDSPGGRVRNDSRSATILQLPTLAPQKTSVVAATPRAQQPNAIHQTNAIHQASRNDQVPSMAPVSARAREFLRGLNEILETVLPESGQVEDVDFASTNS